jgi:hypothetical protein
MQVKDYKDWKEDFLKKSDSNSGNTVGIRFEGVTSSLIPQVKHKLKDIPVDCVEYAIEYCSPSFVKDSEFKRVMIILDGLDEFDDACGVHQSMLVKDSPDHFVSVFVGGHTLFIQLKVTDASKDAISMLQQGSSLPENYDGVKVEDED